MISQNFLFPLSDVSRFQRDIEAFLKQHNHHSVLVQVFLGLLDQEQVQAVAKSVAAAFPPHSVIIGATTSGEILEGEMLEHQVVISVSLFQSASLRSASITEFDSFDDLGRQLAEQVTDADTQAVILMMDGLQVNGEKVVKAFSQHAQGKPLLAGGMAGDYSKFQHTWLIYQGQVLSGGAVAVGLSGQALRAFNTYNLSWSQLGPKMTVTRSEGGRVYEIDHQPIIDVYRKYLGDEVVANMPDSTIEFPLIIQNQAMPVARSMVQVFDDGSIFFAGNLEKGSVVRFGVANLQALNQAHGKMKHTLASEGAEACFIYSCTARKAFWGNALENEFKPIAEVAPVAGFFTYGEVYHFGGEDAICPAGDTLLNVTTTVLGLSESERPERTQFEDGVRAPQTRQERRSLSNSALIHLVNETTAELSDELDENNKLIQLLNQYQTAINASFIVSKTDVYGRITYANRQFERVSGYSAEELVGRSHNIVRHPDNPPYLFREIWTTILAKKVWRGVIKNRAKDGSTYIVKTSIVPIINLEGEITEFLSLREDITGQERQRKTIEKEKAKVQSILDNQKSLIVMYNTQNQEIEEVNRYLLDFTGFASKDAFKAEYPSMGSLFIQREGFLEKEIEGRPWYDYVLSHPEGEHNALIASKDGQEHIFSVSVSRMEESPNYLIKSFSDVTPLEKARAKAEQANQAKSAFLSSMSHELRTPLNSILGFGDLLGMSQLDEIQREQLGEIRKSSQHLLTLINDILDLAKIDAGHLNLNPESIELCGLLRECVNMLDKLAAERKVSVELQCSDVEAWSVSADYTRVKQIALNFVSNAIKYNRKGGSVLLFLERVKHQGDRFVRLSVQDNGMGIPKSFQDKVFEPFNRLGRESKTIEGTGIGLSICQSLANAMQGQVGFESEEGKGSRFWVELPEVTGGATGSVENSLTQATPALSEASEVTAEARKQVLYIEDNVANMKLMSNIVKKLPNIELTIAVSAEEGIEKARSITPDLILLDINLPGMSGKEALPVLRALPNLQARQTEIVAVTANAMKGDVEAGMQVGFDDYLTKPIDFPAIMQLLQK